MLFTAASIFYLHMYMHVDLWKENTLAQNTIEILL